MISLMFIRGLRRWVIVLALGPLQGIAWADETGTLVVLARTSSAAIVSVDSRITYLVPGEHANDPPVPAERTDPTSKLLEVGATGACAIQGWEGLATKRVVVATDLREITSSKPMANVDEILDALLTRAGKTWDDMAYELSSLPRHRQIGSTITQLLCADFINGKLRIFRGVTAVGQDGKATHHRLADECGGLLYIAGAMDLGVYADINENPNGIENRYRSNGGLSTLLAKVSRDLMLDTEQLTLFGRWKRVANETFLNRHVACAGGMSSTSLKSWSNNDVRNITKSLFTAVEKYMPEVGAPNNTRITSKYGRNSLAVEDQWQFLPRRVAHP